MVPPLELQNLSSIRAGVRNATIGLTEEQYKAREITAAKHQSITTSLKWAGKWRYGGLWSELEKDFTRRQDNYPPDLTNAYNVLLNYKAPPIQHQPRQDTRGEDNVSGMSFL
jgi:hypothetical protein